MGVFMFSGNFRRALSSSSLRATVPVLPSSCPPSRQSRALFATAAHQAYDFKDDKEKVLWREYTSSSLPWIMVV